MTPTVFALNPNHLKTLIDEVIRTQGPACDLNHLYVGYIEFFEGLFKGTGFCGDVSQWDMRKARSTSEMFMDTPFNGDVSNWRMPRLEDATRMFAHAPFNGDVSQWGCPGLIRRYQFEGMFNGAAFAQDLSAWSIAPVRETFQVTSFKAMTRNPTLWAAISDKEAPAVPDGAKLRATTAQAYAKLFGGDEGLAQYLKTVPFGPMHFDVCSAAPTCPPGVQEEDYRWCQDLLAVGVGLGLDNTQLRALFFDQWAQRAQQQEVLDLADLCNGAL